MSTMQLLRAVVNERLSVAAEEIYEAVKKTIDDYEEELRRQQRLLQAVLQPRIKLEKPAAEPPQLTLSVLDEGQRLQRGTVEEPPLADKTPEVKEEAISIMFISPYVKNGPDQLQSAGGEAEPLPGPSAEPGQTKPELEEDGDTASSSSATDHSDEEWRGSEESNTEDSDGKGSSQKVSRLPKGPQLHPVKKARCKTRFCCKICGKSFHHTMSLVNHVEVHGRDVCGVCGKRLKDEEAFRAHLRMHNKGKVCGYCGKCFGSYSSMEKHLRVHTGEKPFKCSECGKSFNCHHNMVRHVRLHTGEKPHHCSICGKAFTRKTAVQAHMKRHAAEK